MYEKTKISLAKYVIAIPGVENGMAMMKGTRLPVSFILMQIALGWSLKDLKSRYPEIKLSYLRKIVEGLAANAT